MYRITGIKAVLVVILGAVCWIASAIYAYNYVDSNILVKLAAAVVAVFVGNFIYCKAMHSLGLILRAVFGPNYN